MASKASAATTTPETNGNGPKAVPSFTPPAGYQQSAADVDQFWVEEDGPIHGKLLSAKSYVHKLTRRINYIFVFELVAPCQTASSKGERFERKAEKGEIVGVWGCPGMRGLLGLGDCYVWMVRDGEKDLGRAGQKPMKTYKHVHKGTPKRLVIQSSDAIDPDNATANEAAQESDAIPF